MWKLREKEGWETIPYIISLLIKHDFSLSTMKLKIAPHTSCITSFPLSSCDTCDISETLRPSRTIVLTCDTFYGDTGSSGTLLNQYCKRYVAWFSWFTGR